MEESGVKVPVARAAHGFTHGAAVGGWCGIPALPTQLTNVCVSVKTRHELRAAQRIYPTPQPFSKLLTTGSAR